MEARGGKFTEGLAPPRWRAGRRNFGESRAETELQSAFASADNEGSSINHSACQRLQPTSSKIKYILTSRFKGGGTRSGRLQLRWGRASLKCEWGRTFPLRRLRRRRRRLRTSKQTSLFHVVGSHFFPIGPWKFHVIWDHGMTLQSVRRDPPPVLKPKCSSSTDARTRQSSEENRDPSLVQTRFQVSL